MVIDSDLLIVLGMLMALLAVPTVAKSFVEERKPTIALAMLTIGLIVFCIGMLIAPGGFSLARVPLALVEILARLFN